MLWWAHIASQILKIVLPCHISMLLSRNQCDGMWYYPFVRLYYHHHTILTDLEAVPHMATDDDEYDGYYIPKGTIVFGSAWPV